MIPRQRRLGYSAAVGVTRVVVDEVLAREGVIGALDSSNTGMCGSIPRSFTSQFSVSAEP